MAPCSQACTQKCYPEPCAYQTTKESEWIVDTECFCGKEPTYDNDDYSQGEINKDFAVLGFMICVLLLIIIYEIYRLYKCFRPSSLEWVVRNARDLHMLNGRTRCKCTLMWSIATVMTFMSGLQNAGWLCLAALAMSNVVISIVYHCLHKFQVVDEDYEQHYAVIGSTEIGSMEMASSDLPIATASVSEGGGRRSLSSSVSGGGDSGDDDGNDDIPVAQP
eukprot:CAMPEP_0182457394 /NCGR_PEP_ID=MMETSP1319-20130603/2969_1 /TAXON_ID=172717 /ORGANISM="Bolidomonas pacifica, Strain RCC208" /LENGTH=219 /DNA_ID=CAMNT_0024655849 /DNA_START=309 /DNA_END=965 /DNA_ORIENTATION=-